MTWFARALLTDGLTDGLTGRCIRTIYHRMLLFGVWGVHFLFFFSQTPRMYALSIPQKCPQVLIPGQRSWKASHRRHLGCMSLVRLGSPQVRVH